MCTLYSSNVYFTSATCTIHSALTVMEILLRMQAARCHQGFDLTLSWWDVFIKYQQRFNCIFNGSAQGDKCWGRLFGMLNILRDEGVIDEVWIQFTTTANIPISELQKSWFMLLWPAAWKSAQNQRLDLVSKHGLHQSMWVASKWYTTVDYNSLHAPHAQAQGERCLLN